MKTTVHKNSFLPISIRLSTVLVLLVHLLGSVTVTPAHAMVLPPEFTLATLIVPDNYSTIQAAVNASSAGGTIFVRAGTYYEHVTINKALTLIGENRVTTIIDGSATGEVIYVNANNVSISGFTVKNAVRGIHYYLSNNGRIQDVLVTGNSSVGIFLQQSTYTVVEDSTVTGNYSGIDLGDTGSAHTTIQQVTSFSNTTYGIVGYFGSTDTTISNCSIHGNSTGIAIGWSQFWYIEDSSVYANVIGIYIDSANYATVMNSDFYSNTQGVRFTGFYADYHLFEGNRFYGNTASGMTLNNDARNNTVRSNDFYNNLVGVEILNSANRQSYNNTFYQNSFINNTINATIGAPAYSNTWDNGYPGGGNYWDDYTGGDVYHGAAQDVAGRDGIGDTAYVLAATTNVDRYPLMGLYAANDGPTLLGNPTYVTASTLLTRAFTYSWTFGDGTTGTGAAAAHTYATSGPFTATGTATFGGIELTGSTIVTIIYVPHTNADLSNLVLSTGALTPAFAADTTVYTQSVANIVTSLTVTPTVADATATVTVNGTPVVSGDPSSAIALAVGDNLITTVVTAEDGTTIKTYTVTVTRVPSANADLSSLVLSTGALTPAFSPGTTGYTQAVANAVTSLTITPTVAEANATVIVNGIPIVSGNPSGAIALTAGPNLITIIVTAEDGTTIKTYTITVTRAYVLFLPLIRG